MSTDAELLSQHVRDGSEAAFAEIVQRYAGLVYSAALRSVGYRPHLAEDITQDVFIILARRAPMLIRHEALAGWLHTTTRQVARSMLRNLQRRATRELEAAAMHDNSAPEPSWEQLCPLLDQAVEQLDDRDRNAVLLRYFQGQSHREVGDALGLSEDTARVRTERAVEKLRRHFKRNGIAVTGASLAEVLAANAAMAAPPGLAGKVAAVAQAKGLGFGHAILKAVYMTTKTKIALAAAVLLLAAAIPFAISYQQFSPAGGVPASAPPPNGVKNSIPSTSDPLAAARAGLVRAMRTPGRMIRNRVVLDYVGKLDAATVKALLDELAGKSLPTSMMSEDPRSYLVHRWSEVEPEAALAWMLELPDRNAQIACAQEIFDTYSAKDPAAAFNALLKLPAGLDSSGVMVPVIINFARQDPRAALAALQDSQKYPQATFIVFDQWARMDPVGAAAEVLKMPEGMPSLMALRSIAKTWAEQDSAAALAWADTLSGQPQIGAKRAIVEGMSTWDPARAAELALNIPEGPLGGMIATTITRNWAQTDPAGLLAWANNNLDGRPYDIAVTAALRQMASADPASTATYLAQHPDLGMYNDLVPVMAGAWAGQDMPAALAWAQSLPTDNLALRDSAMGKIFSDWTNLDPAAVGAYLQKNLAGDPSFNAIAAQLVKNWGSADPQAAFDWTISLGDEKTRNAQAVRLVGQWAGSNPTAAAVAAQAALGNLSGLTSAQKTALQTVAAKTANP